MKKNNDILNKIIKSQDGFLGLLAIVVIVVVGGGTVYSGTKIIKKIHENGCGDAFGRWSSGQTYADLADGDNMDAIDDAIKCREATYVAIRTAKPVAGMMSGSTNIGVGADNIATVFVDRVMDTVENNSKPPTKNNPLPDDIKAVINSKETDKDKTEDGATGNILGFLDDVKEKIDSVDIGETNEPMNDDKDQSLNVCALGFSLNSAPKLKIECPNNPTPGSESFTNVYFSDPEGDIKSFVFRTVIKIPEYNGEQVGPWTTTVFNGKGKCGSDISPSTTIPSDFGLGEVRASFWFEAYLVDIAGNKSNTAICKILEVN